MSLFPSLRESPFQHLRIRRFSQRLSATVRPTNWLGAAQWVLSRPLYRFRAFDLAHVPRPQRAQALRLQIRHWSPYPNSGQYVVWQQERALVWTWDADRLNADLVAERLKPGSTRVIPETLLHPPMISGARLVACLDGVEGQLWQEQRPVHSRWWPQKPTIEEWLNFRRDAGSALAQEQSIPAVQNLPLLQRPWAKSAELGQGDSQSFPHEALLIGTAVVVLAALTTWEAIELVKTRLSIAELNAQLASVDQSARPLLDARRQSLDSLARIKTLESLNPYPPQLTLLAEVSKQLASDGAYLKEWDYQNGKIRMTIASANKLSSSSLVKRLQDAGSFTNVQAAPSNDPGSLALTMETLSRREARPRPVSPTVLPPAPAMPAVPAIDPTKPAIPKA